MTMNGKDLLKEAKRLSKEKEMSLDAGQQFLFQLGESLIENQHSLEKSIDKSHNNLITIIETSNKDLRACITESMAVRDKKDDEQDKNLTHLFSLRIIKANIWAKDNTGKFWTFSIIGFLLFNAWLEPRIRHEFLALLPFVTDNWLEFLTKGT